MSLDHFLDKTSLGFAHIFDCLTGHRVRKKPDEIAGMSGGERHSDFAVVLHAANSRAMTGARVEHDKRPFARVDRSAFGRDNPYQRVIHRAGQQAPIEDQLDVKVQHVRRLAGIVLDAIIAALTQYVQE